MRSFVTASPSSSSSPQNHTPEPSLATSPGLFRVQLIRSSIGLPARTRLSLRTLGIRKRNQFVYLPRNASSVGVILKLKALVKVDLVEQGGKEKEKENKKMERERKRGFTIVGNMLQQNAV